MCTICLTFSILMWQKGHLFVPKCLELRETRLAYRHSCTDSTCRLLSRVNHCTLTYKKKQMQNTHIPMLQALRFHWFVSVSAAVFSHEGWADKTEEIYVTSDEMRHPFYPGEPQLRGWLHLWLAKRPHVDDLILSLSVCLRVCGRHISVLEFGLGDHELLV